MISCTSAMQLLAPIPCNTANHLKQTHKLELIFVCKSHCQHRHCLRHAHKQQHPQRLVFKAGLSPEQVIATTSKQSTALTAASMQETSDPVSLIAWLVVGAAFAASLYYMTQAFGEAKAAIQRREEGEKLKKQQDDEQEAARKQKIKDMFERL